MDDGKQCLLDVIGDPNALDSFLDPLESVVDGTTSSGDNLASNQRFPDLAIDTNAPHNDTDDIFADLFSPNDSLPSPLATNGISDSIQSAAALAGITDIDGLEDQPAQELTQTTPLELQQTVSNLSANINQSNNTAPQIKSTVHIANTTQQALFGQPTTSFAAAPQVQSAAPTQIQRLQPISNVSPHLNAQTIQNVNAQPVQQQQATIALPANNTGSSIQVSLTPQQLAAIQQSGGRIQASGNTIQVVPNPMPQPQIVQAIGANGAPIQLALLPSGVQFGQHIVIRQPLKPGAKLGPQPIMPSPSKAQLNIQPKITTASPIKPPVSIRPYQVLAPQVNTVPSSAPPQGNIILQHPTQGQTIQLTNLAQQPAAPPGQNIIIQNPVSGSAVVTMGVSHGSIIVMTQTRPTTTTSQPQQQLTNTVSSSSVKPSLAPSPSPASQSPQPTKPKPAPKKKKSKKKTKEKESKNKPVTSSASVTQSVTTLTTTSVQQTAPSVSYAQTYVTNNGQTIVVQAPIKQGDGAVPIVQQINISAPPQQPVHVQQPQQADPAQPFQQYSHVTVNSSGQQIISSIPQPSSTTQMVTAEQQQQLFLQQIRQQQQRGGAVSQQSMVSPNASVSVSQQQGLQSHLQALDPRKTPSPSPQVIPQLGGQNQLLQSQLQVAQNQLQQGQSQLQSSQGPIQLGQAQLVATDQNQLQTSKNQLQLTQTQVATSQNQLQMTQTQTTFSQNQYQILNQLNATQTGQNQLQPVASQPASVQSQLNPGLALATSQSQMQQNQLSSGQNQFQGGQLQTTSGQNQQQQQLVLQSSSASSFLQQQTGIPQPTSIGQLQGALGGQVQPVQSSAANLLNQLQSVPGSQSQPVQNQVQLVSSSQSTQNKTQHAIGQTPQQQQIATSTNQQQLASTSVSQQQQIASKQQQITTSSLTQQQHQQQQQGSQPLEQQQLQVSATGGIHVIRTNGQAQQPQKVFRSLQELQAWLQQNPQALRQLQELKRQHMMKQQQMKQQQGQGSPLQQQELQQQGSQQQQQGLQQVIQQQQQGPQQLGFQQQQGLQQQQTGLQQQPSGIQPSQGIQQQVTTSQIQLQSQSPLQVQQSQQQGQQLQTLQQGQQLLNQPLQQQLQQTQQSQGQLNLLQPTQQQLNSSQQQLSSSLPSTSQSQLAFQLQQVQQSSQQSMNVQQTTQLQTSQQQQPLQVQPPQQSLPQTSALPQNNSTSQPQTQQPLPKLSPLQKPSSSFEKSFQQFIQSKENAEAQKSGKRKIHDLPKQDNNMSSIPTPVQPMSIQGSTSAPMQPVTLQGSASTPVPSMSLQGSTSTPIQPVSISGQPQQVVQGRANISPQIQQQLQVLQAKIKKLSTLPNPTQDQSNLLQQYMALQQRVVTGTRHHIMRNSRAMLSPTQNSSALSGAGSPNKPMVPGQPSQQNPTQLASPSSSTAATTSNQTQKTGIPGLKIVSSANLTPQQKVLMNQLTEQLKKLTPEQQKQLIQQQQLLKISQGKQGGKLIIQPASSTAVANPQNIVSAGKIIIQGKKSASDGEKRKKKVPQGPSKAQMAKSNRFARKLLKDQVQCQSTDNKTPFKNRYDAVTRLMPFHLFKDDTLTDKELETAEEKFEEECTVILKKKQEMLNKYQMLLYGEAMRTDPSAEMVMIDRMFIHEEKISLEADKKHALQHPEIYDELVASRPSGTTDSATDLDSTAISDNAADSSLVQSPTTSTKKLDKSDSYSTISSPTQAESETYSNLDDSKATVSPHSSTSSSSHNHTTDKRGGSESSSRFEDSSDEHMDSSYDNATVTKVSATNLKVTFRKQKKTKSKKKTSARPIDSSATSLQNHVDLKVEPDDLPSSHSIKTEPDFVKTEADFIKQEEDCASSNGSTNGSTESSNETKPHQRHSDSCIPFRKRKFKQIADDFASDKDVESRTSSNSTPTPAPSDKMPRVDDSVEYVKTVFRFDSFDRTSDSVFKDDKPVIKKPAFEFENVSDPEDDNDTLQEQMTSAINILDSHRSQETKLSHSFSMEGLLPTRPEVDNLANNPQSMFSSRLPSSDSSSPFNFSTDYPNHSNPLSDYPNQSNPPSMDYPNQSNPSSNITDYSNQNSKPASPQAPQSHFPSFSQTTSYSSTASTMDFGDTSSSNAIDGLSYGGAFNMEDTNITQTVSSQEFFGTESYSSPPPEEETSIVDDLQKELNMLQGFGPEPDDNDDGLAMSGLSEDSGIQQERRTDPDLEEAINSILF